MADELSVARFINPQGTGPIIRNDQGAGAGASRDFIRFDKAGSEVFSVDANGLPDPGGSDAVWETTVSYGDVPADADALEPYLMKALTALTVTGISITSDTNMGDCSGADKQTFTVKRSSDGAALATWQATANPGLTAATEQSLGSVSNGALGVDEYLYLTFTKASSGVAVSGLTVHIEGTRAA